MKHFSSILSFVKQSCTFLYFKLPHVLCNLYLHNLCDCILINWIFWIDSLNGTILLLFHFDSLYLLFLDLFIPFPFTSFPLNCLLLSLLSLLIPLFILFFLLHLKGISSFEGLLQVFFKYNHSYQLHSILLILYSCKFYFPFLPFI